MDGTLFSLFLLLSSSWTHADVRDGGFAALSAPLARIFCIFNGAAPFYLFVITYRSFSYIL